MAKPIPGENFRTAAAFIGVGGAGAAAYAVLAAALTAAGAAPWIASVCCYAALVPVVYWAQRRVTFQSNRPHKIAFPKYVAAQLIGLTLAAVLPQAAPQNPPFPPIFWFAAIVAAISALNFMLLKFWTFAVQD